MSIQSEINKLHKELPQDVKLVAVSKFHPAGCIMEAYEAGQRIFGESRPQEFAEKCKALPDDIEWHFIGHLQTNKLKLVLPYVRLLQSADSLHLLEAVDKWAGENGRKISVLLEMHLGAEETKHGLAAEEVMSIMRNRPYKHVAVKGLMGMATNTSDETVIRRDFARIDALRREILSSCADTEDFTELSIGMSDDYRIALEFHPTLVRIGSKIFGPRV